MTEPLRFPQPDGSTKVIDPVSGDVTFENKPKPALGRSNEDRVFQNVELPKEEPFRIPEGTAETYKTNADTSPPPAPDMVSQQATEAAKQKAPEYPAGAPELQSVLKLDFRERAQAMKLYQGAIDAWNKMPALGTTLDTFDKMDRYFQGLAAFDDLLKAVAVSQSEYSSWRKNTDDGAFSELFFTYVARFSLGEA